MDNPLEHIGKGEPKDKRRQQLMVGATIVLVVLGVLTLKKMGGGGGGSAMPGGVGGAVGSEGSGGSTGVASNDATQQSEIDTLASQFALLNDKVTHLTSAIPAPNTGNHAAPDKKPTPVTPVHHHEPNHPSKKPAPKHAPAKPAAKTHSYTVKKGDNLSKIGRMFGESWQQVYKTNKKTVGGNPNFILPGQKLTVNGPAKPSATAGKAAIGPAKPAASTHTKPVHPPKHG